MGILNWFAKSRPVPLKLAAGSFTVDRLGRVLTTTVSSGCPRQLLDDTAHNVLSLFREARAAQIPMAGLDFYFAGLHIKAREMQGGAIIFLSPRNTPAALPPNKKDSL